MRFLSNMIHLVVLVLTVASCTVTPVVITRTQTQKIEAGAIAKSYFAYYALPRTVVDVEVVVEKKISKPGPFAASAERYLGVNQVITREKTEYRIKSVVISQHPEKDPAQLFKLLTSGSSAGARVSLTPEGVIAGINLPWKPLVPNGATTIVQLREDDFYFPGYPDLSVKKNMASVADTMFRVLRTDTSFVNIPILRHTDQKKTQPMMEKEAADLIYNLRESRYFLLNGEYAYLENETVPMPEGEALEIILRELARMESDYMSLFIGRTQTEESVHRFSFTPEGKGITEATVLFAFSAQRGVLEPDDASGEAVRLQMTRTDENPLDHLKYELDNPKNPVKTGLAYRVPEKAMAEIVMGREQLFVREMLVAQFGRLEFLPDDILSGDHTCVEFYPAYGSIKSIYTK